jgi:DNA-binding transcriptional LysR family regulator
MRCAHGYADRMQEFTLAGLRVVRAVAAAGSFTAAAETLGYTQSAVSRQVAAMEAAAGSVLFERGARGVTASPAGEVLLRYAVSALGEVEAAEHALAGLRDRLAGRLTLGAFPTAAAVLAPRAVAALRVAHPGLTVALDEAPTPALLRRLRTGRIEVAVIGVGEGLPDYDLDGLWRATLPTGDLCIAVSTTHHFTRQQRVLVSELHQETWIAGVGNEGDPQFGPWPTLHHPRIGYSARSLPSRLGLVAAGLGITVLPALAAASVPAGVQVLAVEDPDWHGRAAVVATGPQPSAAATALVQALRREAARLDQNGTSRHAPVGVPT